MATSSEILKRSISRRNFVARSLAGVGLLSTAGGSVDATYINHQMESDAWKQAKDKYKSPLEGDAEAAKEIVDNYQHIAAQVLRNGDLGRFEPAVNNAIGKERAIKAQAILDERKAAELNQKQERDNILNETRPASRHWIRASLILGGVATIASGLILETDDKSQS